MEPFNPSKIELSIKDSTKGQKIAAALYLVTDHLSDTDPLKNMVRAHAVTFMQAVGAHVAHLVAERITDTLTVAVLARLISEKNASIIILELRHFVTRSLGGDDSTHETLLAHFGETDDRYQPSLSTFKKTHTPDSSMRQTSFRSAPPASVNSVNQLVVKQGTKTDRQAQILSLINERKSAGIKDIAGLFTDTSEKTIQRELGVLVASGRITKRGQKRWSVYMAVTA